MFRQLLPNKNKNITVRYIDLAIPKLGGHNLERIEYMVNFSTHKLLLLHPYGRWNRSIALPALDH
jgi:hypothetical protein